MKVLRNKLGKILDVSFSDEKLLKINQDEVRRIRLVNYISLISIFNMVSYIIFYCLADFQLFRFACIFLSIASILTIGIIIINKQGKYLTAKILLSVLTPFSMSFIATIAFGKAPGFQIYLFVAAIIPLFLWSNRQKQYPTILIIAILILYVIIEFFPPLFEPKIVLSEDYISLFKMTNVSICFLSAGIAIGFYQYLYRKQEEQLVKQKELLKISQAHKDKVYSIIAHDLRGPFGTFANLTELYIKKYHELSNDKRLEVIQSMHQTSALLQNLLENLLDWSKMQSGDLKKSLKHFKLKKLAEESIALHKELIMEKKQIFEINIDSDISIYADHYMVFTVFRNLISNAIKFTKPQGEISISAIENKTMVQICIKDSGIGLSNMEIKNLFDIQKKDEILTANILKGSGLGLVLCKEFIENQNGKIWIESELGKGSNFYFTLPKSKK